MPVATTTALLIGAGIAGGTSLAAGAMGAHAAGKAADQQQESADKSLALQQQMYQQQRADLAPWRNTGGQAVNTLGGLMGLPQGPVQGPNSGVTSNIGPPAGTMPNRYGEGFGILQPGVTPAQARDPNFKYQGPQSAQGAPMVSLAPPQGQPQQQNASSYVQMRAPTGEVQPVPANQVAHYEQMGARRVG